jgi:hypothetical protein
LLGRISHRLILSAAANFIIRWTLRKLQHVKIIYDPLNDLSTRDYPCSLTSIRR